MTVPTDKLQRITVLTPAAEILARISASVPPIVASDLSPDAAVGYSLAADVKVPDHLPPYAVALQDGWAVASEQISDASSYAPAVLTTAPQWLNAGQRMPEGTDAVLPPDAVSIVNGHTEVHASAAQGEGVLPAQSHFAKGSIVCGAGRYLRAIDAAILRALGIKEIPVRVPRVKIFSSAAIGESGDFIGPFIARAVKANGGLPEPASSANMEAVFAKPDADAVIVIGGSGMGRNDNAVNLLTRYGKVDFHGFGISPGQTAAFGSVNGCPVLILPGRLDAALAVFLIVGHALLARLSGAKDSDAVVPMPLTKKITSTIGLAEVIFVRRTEGGVEPLGAGVVPLQGLLQASGWILVPPASEGLAAGATVDVRKLP